MARDHMLMFTLCAIVVINIIAILLLNNRLADEQSQQVLVNAPSSSSMSSVSSSSVSSAAVVASSQVIETGPLVRTLILTDPVDCPDCYDINNYVATLNETIYMQPEQVPLMENALFHSTIYPALAFNQTIEQYPGLTDGWQEAGYTINISSGPYAGMWYVLPSKNAPYYNTTDDHVHGRVTVTYLTMQSCTGCYDVYQNRVSLNASHITPYSEITIDVNTSAGQALIAMYNITEVPTILMDEEAAAYPNLEPGWSLVGTIEPDGTYVLRNLQRLEVTYYDLDAKKLMKP